MTENGQRKASFQARILVVEDDASMGKVIRYNLEEDGHQVSLVARGDEAIEALTRTGRDDPPPYELVITDIKLPGADGMQVLAAARKNHPGLPVVLVTAFGSVESAIAAMNEGAVDYITKPFRRQEFKTRIAGVLERVALQHENRKLRQQVERQQGTELLTASARMQALLRVVDKVAPSDVSVLIAGESGTGKELVARMLHLHSNRSAMPFVPLNCAALPANLLEAELFGHVRGAFTGADRARAGRFEQADRGTLFLDEIGEMPLELQSKLLRVLDDGMVDRLGATRSQPVDVRIVAATNRDLQAAVSAGSFRSDLFHRLGVVPLSLIPLRERPEDIELLARHFVAQQTGATHVTLAPALLTELEKRPWPGNVRELKNLIARMVMLRQADVLDLADLAPPGTTLGQPGEDRSPPPTPDTHAAEPQTVLRPGELVLPDEGFSLPKLEHEIVLKAIEKCAGNRSAAARFLGIPRHVLLYRLEKQQKLGSSVKKTEE
jgi:DNA-binding NtrC family response regulator